MKGDFARVTYNPAQHYSQVFQQQGRVMLEADWNEQAAIQLHLLRALAMDLVGPCWAAGAGFRIVPGKTASPAWTLSAGHFYVDGILCVNETQCTLESQPRAPTPDYRVGHGTYYLEAPLAPYVLWLDVWERHLSSVEAPHIVDPALNGVDTCSRAEIVWQLRVLVEQDAQSLLRVALVAMRLRHAALDGESEEAGRLGSAITSIERISTERLDEIFASIGSSGGTDRDNVWCAVLRQVLALREMYVCPRLAARLRPPESDEDPCVIAADARYRGCENQLYRIEIHNGGLAVGKDDTGKAASLPLATFKWSRENGSVIFPVLHCTAPGEPLVDGSRTMKAALASLGRDTRLGLDIGDRVELLDDDQSLSQDALPLLEVVEIDVPSRIVTLAVPDNSVPTVDLDKHPLLRRWDQREGLQAWGVVEVREDEWMELEDGVQIRFNPGGLYAHGDYWQIPARVAGNGTIDWPYTRGPDGKPVSASVATSGLHHQAVLGGTSSDGKYVECCCRLVPLCAQRLSNASGAPKVADWPTLDSILAKASVAQSAEATRTRRGAASAAHKRKPS